jgi:anti-anti-sigma factor
MLPFFRRRALSTPRNNPTQNDSRWLDELHQRAHELTAGELVFDLHDVQAINSQQLGEIIKVHLKLRQHDRRLVLENVSACLLGVFELTRLDRMVEIHAESNSAMLV